jgi:MFS family permease
LTVSVIIYGAAMSVSAVPALAFVTEAARPENHARVQGFNGAVQGLSALIGALSVGLLLQLTSPEVAFVVVTVLALLVLVAVAQTNDQTGSRRPGFQLAAVVRSYARVITLVRTSRHVQLAGLVSLNYTFVFLVIGNSFLPLLIIKNLGLSAAFAGLVLGLRSIVATIVSSFFGSIVGHIGFRNAMLATNATAAVGVLLTAVAHAPVVFLLLAALQGVGCGFSAATANLLVVSATAETERALGFSTASFVSRIGTLLLPLLLGGILQLAGITATFLVAGFISTGCVVALTLLSGIMTSLEPVSRSDVLKS